MARVRKLFLGFALACALAGPSRVAGQTPAMDITSISPSVVSYLGRTPFEIRGSGFTSATDVIIGTMRFTPEFVDATRLVGTLPPHAATAEPLDVRVTDARGGGDVLPRALSYVAPFTLLSISPRSLPAAEGGYLTLTGSAFTPSTRVDIGGTALEEVEFVDAYTLRARAPAKHSGLYDVSVTQPIELSPPMRSTLERVLLYDDTFELPSPQEIETSLAEGTARFHWANPTLYDAIEVLDSEGRLLRRLPGDARYVELPATGLDGLEVKIQGLSGDVVSDLARAVAKIFECTPPALAGDAQPGELELSLRGGHAPAEPDRCADDGATNVGEAAALLDGRVTVADLGSGGPIIAPGGGIVRQEWQRRYRGEPNSWTTGFLLEEDAIVLEIAGYYEQTARFPGLELRARIVQVASPDDPLLENGFTDEFTFPDVTANEPKKWHLVNYFRANKDVSHVPDPDDPSDTAPEPCRDDNGDIRTIPRGEYLLELYAVGGDPGIQHYAFADDGRPHELLIPGAPCPPYPLVRVRDMTGRRTLPVIQQVDARTTDSRFFSKPFVRLQAIGSWLDEAGNPHAIGPAGEPDNPDFEYVWTIYDRGGVPTTKSSGSSSSIATEVEDWGCYYIDLTVRDKGCPRSVTRSYQIAVTPSDVECQPGNQFFSFLFPTPEPSGIAGIVGLDPPPGLGRFETQRPVEFSILVAPKYICDGKDGSAVFVDGAPADVRFALATKFNGIYTPIPGVELTITDLCPDVTTGMKYLHVKVDDLGAIPHVGGVSGPKFRDVYFVGRTDYYYYPTDTTNSHVDRQPTEGETWHPIGTPLRLANRPQVLERSRWSGYFDEKDATYHFSFQASTDPRQHFDIGASDKIPLPIDDAPVDINIPSFGNDLTTGFNARFMVHQEEFLPETGEGGAHGELLGNRIEGVPLQIAPTTVNALALNAPSLPEYEWENCETLFESSLRQTLFESILYTGSIGPVPVTVWASIALGIDMLLQSETEVAVRPFAPVSGSGDPMFESHFRLYGELDLAIPCEIRADVLFGVASIAARLIPEASINLRGHVGAVETTPELGAYLRAAFSLYFEVEACIWALVDEICYSPGRVSILEDKEIIRFDYLDGGAGAAKCTPSAIIAAGPLGGEGAGVDQTFRVLATSRPGIGISPNGDFTLYSWAVEAPEGSFGNVRTLGIFAVNDQSVFNVNQAVPDVIDPDVAFVTNDRALVAWTRGESPSQPIPAVGLAARNIIAALQDILVTPIRRSSSSWSHQGDASFFRVSDDPAEVPAAERRADGMATIAADTSLPAVQAGGEALVAWVRYEGPFLVEDGTQTKIYDRSLRFQDGAMRPYFTAREVDTVRSNLEHTAIYARRIGASGPTSAAVKISPAGTGINVEPTLAVSPSGNRAYCVWVHDSSIDADTGLQHVNLVDSNRGRQLLYSVYSKATGLWSAPAPVLADPDAYPGLLEPDILLRADADGLLAFTALGEDAPAADSGLANNRYVFACRLEGGVFGEPVLIHGKCLAPETGHWPQVAWSRGLDLPGVSSEGADFVITYQGTGPSGSRAGAGNVMVTALGRDSQTWTPPVSLTPDDRVHSNLTAAVSPSGVIRTFHLDGGPARVLGGGGAGLAPASVRRMQAIEIALEPDAAIVACRLSDQFPAPGSRVTATVEVENRGFSGTAVDSGGRSQLSLSAVLIGEDGNERVAASSRVPVLQPGEVASLPLALEMPHDPVRLEVRVAAGGLDRDLSNNTSACYFGAPAPENVTVTTRFYGSGAEDGDDPVENPPRAAVRLAWTNPAAYEEVRIYRDGGMIASLSGGATVYVDAYAPPGRHDYEVRGLLGASRSMRTVREVDVPSEPAPGGEFRRGDGDGSGDSDITDPIGLLNYLFLGGARPLCPDAVDADDSGDLEITDAIRILGYLFLGGSELPAPGPRVCGPDPTADALPPCDAVCR